MIYYRLKVLRLFLIICSCFLGFNEGFPQKNSGLGLDTIEIEICDEMKNSGDFDIFKISLLSAGDTIVFPNFGNGRYLNVFVEDEYVHPNNDTSENAALLFENCDRIYLLYIRKEYLTDPYIELCIREVGLFSNLRGNVNFWYRTYEGSNILDTISSIKK